MCNTSPPNSSRDALSVSPGRGPINDSGGDRGGNMNAGVGRGDGINVRMGQYMVDAGCFISQTDRLVVLDPDRMNAYVDAVTPRTSEQTDGGRGRSSGDDQELGCCMVTDTKPGLWTVYGVCEDFGGGEWCQENDEDFPDCGGSEDERVVQFAAFNNSEIDVKTVTPSFLNSLDWQKYSDVHPINEARGMMSFSSLVVQSGQAGVFCAESIMSHAHQVVGGRGQMSNGCRSSATKEERVMEWLYEWYIRACELTCMDNQIGIMDVTGGPVGAVCASGLGDQGTYDVQILRDAATKEIWGLRIVFMNT